MILLVHIVLGAAMGSIIRNPFLAVILAFLSHYLIDIPPHIEYSIKNIKDRAWEKSLPDFLKVFLDISFGVVLIFLFSQNSPIVYLCGFIAIVPDGLSLIDPILKLKMLKTHSNIHQVKIHFLKNKRVPNFLRILSQVIVVLISILMLIAY